MNDHANLIQAALSARERAYSPYSQFKVGAALQTADGTTITGANVESASYGLSCCAERVAIFKALTEGHINFKLLAIASPGAATPCGACRQIIAEQAPGAIILLIDSNNPKSQSETSINNLLPEAFTGVHLPHDL